MRKGGNGPFAGHRSAFITERGRRKKPKGGKC